MPDVPNRWSDYLRRFFNTRGSGRADFSETITPTVNLMEESAWTAILRDEHLWATTQTIGAGGAGNYSTFHVGGPWNDNYVVCVTSAWGLKTTAGLIALTAGTNPGPASLALHGPARSGDNRVSTPACPKLAVYAVTPAVAYLNVIPTQMAANTWQALNMPREGVVLGPVDRLAATVECLTFQNQTANEAMSLALAGIFVPLHGGEET